MQGWKEQLIIDEIITEYAKYERIYILLTSITEKHLWLLIIKEFYQVDPVFIVLLKIRMGKWITIFKISNDKKEDIGSQS